MSETLADMAIFPAMRFEEEEYARLQMRLDLFSDRVVATRYQRGTAEACFIVDPLAVVQALAGFDIGSGLLPADILFWQQRDGYERVGLWLLPQVWRVRVALKQQAFDWTVPMPGLVLVGYKKTYSLYALAGDERPDLGTRLYYPPCPNVSGSVCTGNVKFPVAGPSTIEEAGQLFFESNFNGHLANKKSRKYPNNILRMWRVLDRCRAERYPVQDLVKSQYRLKDVMKQ